MTTKTTRVDDLGPAYAGSQLQIQLYVNRRSEELSQKVVRGFERYRLDRVALSISQPHGPPQETGKGKGQTCQTTGRTTNL